MQDLAGCVVIVGLWYIVTIVFVDSANWTNWQRKILDTVNSA